MNKWLKGALLCIIASASWGAMFPVANSAFRAIDPFYFTILRYSSVTVILVILLLLKEGKQAFKLDGKGASLWFFGTMAFTVYNLFIFWGQYLLGDNGVIVASIMEALMPLFSVFIIWAYKKDRPSFFTFICMIVAFIGVFFVVTKGDYSSFVSIHSFIPMILLLLAVIGWGVYSIGAGEFSDWSVLRYSTITCLLGTSTAAALVISTSLLGYLPFPTVDTVVTVMPELSFMIIVAGVIALLAWNQGISILSPINAILFINFLPVTTLIVTAVQGYQLTIYDFGGTFLIMAALIGNNIYSRREAEREELREQAIHKRYNKRVLSSE